MCAVCGGKFLQCWRIEQLHAVSERERFRAGSERGESVCVVVSVGEGLGFFYLNFLG